MLTDSKTISPVREALIPAEMKAADRWVVWLAVEKQRRDGGIQLTKEPRQAINVNLKASSTNAATWSDFQTAMAAVKSGNAHGVGFVLGDGWAGVDIDDAVTADHEVTEEAASVIDRLRSYTERSPSKTGLHVIVHGDVPEGRRFGKVEIYANARYFTVTGDMMLTSGPFVEHRHEELNNLVNDLAIQHSRARHLARRATEAAVEATSSVAKEAPASDDEIVELASRVCNGFAELWAGDVSQYDGDASRADMALAGKLAFICGPGQEDLVRRLMHKSSLRREKWSVHRTYLDRTIQRAYDGRTEDKYFKWAARCTSLVLAQPVASDGGSVVPNDDGRLLDLAIETTLDDIGFARRLAAECSNRVRYVSEWGKWIHWDGCRWELDDGAAIVQEAQALRDRLWQELPRLPPGRRSVQVAGFVHACGGAKRLQGIVSLTKSQEVIRIRHAMLDQHPYLLNVRNGTIDLRTGLFRPHCPEDFLTQIAAVQFDPHARAERWEQFVAEAMLDDPGLIRFLQVSAGLMLSGDVSPQLLWCHYGVGSNGKSTFLSGMSNMLGDYAFPAPSNFLMMRQVEAHPTEVAMLYGKRLVTAIECEGGYRLRESFVKMMTGGDKVAARRMREDFWMMDPTWHIHASFNDPPVLNGTDAGIRRRLRIVPWRASFEGAAKDERLKERLESDEYRPGILNWCLEGMRAFMTSGVPTAAAVTQATEEYVASQDLFGMFLEEGCAMDPRAECTFQNFMAAFHKWLEDRGENPTFWKGKRVAAELKRRGFAAARASAGDDRGKTVYRGLYLPKADPRRGY